MTTENLPDPSLLGYARVSTLEQDEALQVDALAPWDARASWWTRRPAGLRTGQPSTEESPLWWWVLRSNGGAV